VKDHCKGHAAFSSEKYVVFASEIDVKRSRITPTD